MTERLTTTLPDSDPLLVALLTDAQDHPHDPCPLAALTD
jgi:hypothetical protein